MFRRYPGVDGDPLQALIQVVVTHIGELHAGHRLVPFPEDADLPGDGSRSDLMVAGDHDGADPASLGVGHGLDGLRPGRVDHGDEADEGKVPLVLQGERPDLRELTVGEGQYPQALHGELHVDPGDALPPLRRHGHLSLPGKDIPGTVQQHVNGALRV